MDKEKKENKVNGIGYGHHDIINLLSEIKSNLSTISDRGHKTGYNWNADPLGLTLLEGDIFSKIDKFISDNN